MVERSAADWSDGLAADFTAMLLADVAAAMRRYDVDQSEPAKRDLIRNLFAAIEGYTRLYREHVIEAARSMDELTLEEELALSEMNYQVTDQGKIVGQRRYLSMLATFRLSTRIAARLNPALAVHFDDGDWDRLRSAVDIRNRITHPKQRIDLEVSAEDMSNALAAFYWLLGTATEAMEATIAALRQQNAEFRNVLAELENGNPGLWAEASASTSDPKT